MILCSPKSMDSLSGVLKNSYILHFLSRSFVICEDIGYMVKSTWALEFTRPNLEPWHLHLDVSEFKLLLPYLEMKGSSVTKLLWIVVIAVNLIILSFVANICWPLSMY